MLLIQDTSLFRLKAGANLHGSQYSWITHGKCYEGYWHSAMKSPPDIVLIHPQDPDRHERVPSPLFEEVNDDQCGK